MSWSPDAQRIVSASDDKTLRIWDELNGESLQVLGGHGCRVYCVSWSPDGKRIVSGAADGRVRVWESRFEDALPMWRAAEQRAKAAGAPPKKGK